MAPTILVPTNDHPAWAERVADVVTDVEDEATAVVLHVFADREVESMRHDLGSDPGESDLDDLAARRAGVSTVADRLDRAGLDVDVRGVEDEEDPATAILAAAEEEDADRIYVYSRTRSPAGRAIFGSTLQELLRTAPIPVMVTPPNAR